MVRVAAILLCGCLASGCARAWLPERFEIAEGRAASRSLLKRCALASDPASRARIAAIGGRLASVCERPAFDYHFEIIVSTMVNAFAFPDGSVFVTTGMLKLIGQDEAALAGVLSHEIGHIARRHGAEHLQSALGFSAISFMLFGLENSLARQAARAGNDLLELGYGREMEVEADLCAIRYIAALGQPPEAGLRFLELLHPMEKRDPGLFKAYLRSHPPTEDRLNRAKDYIRRYIPTGSKAS